MSAPDSVSTRSLPLTGTNGVSIGEGTANLFIVDESGRRWPMLSVIGPMVLVGPDGADAPAVICEVHGAMALDALDAPPRPEDLAPFASALVNAYPQALDVIRERGAAGMPDVVGSIAGAERARQAKVQADLVSGLEKVNRRIDEATADRIRTDIDAPQRVGGRRRSFPSEYPEVEVMRLVGEVAAFEVVEPRDLTAKEAAAVIEIARHSGLRARTVSLASGWTAESTSPLVGFLDSGDGEVRPVALLPARRGFIYQTSIDDAPREVEEGVTPLAAEAVMVYPSLPVKRRASLMDMGRIAMRGSWGTFWLIVACSFAVAVLGLATPIFTNAVLGVFVPQGSIADTLAIGVALVLLALAAGTFVIVQNFATSRLTQLGQLRVEAAIWDRTLRLPLKFFRGYSSGDLAYRIIAIDSLKQLLSSQTVTAILAAVFSLVNFVLLFTYSVPLALAALVVFVITLLFMVWLMRKMSRLIRSANASQQAASAWFVQLVGGISKIRVAGAEQRFTDISLLKQSDQIANQAAQTILSGRLQTFLALISAFSTLAFFVIIGIVTWDNGPTISASQYIAFSTAFGAVLGAVVGVSSAVPALAAAGPTLELVRPILDGVQEQAPDAQPLVHLEGRIEFRDVAFRYREGMPLVLQNLSFTVEPMRTTAIVGPSGSGKTSALRLMAALEYPESGLVLLDGHDLRDIDAMSLRKRLGVVVQGGQVSNGSILDNIGGGAEIPEELAWTVAQQANIADDIDAMPMKMHTVVSPLTLSGGQAQRILIARALARKPDILLLDEATSALDNVSQAAVTNVLASMRVTQVIIAQRLSTLESADRILVMDRGTVVEQGAFDELMAANGLFAALAKRQLANA